MPDNDHYDKPRGTMMKLYNDTAEYIRADEVRVGDSVRHEGHFREVTHISEEETDGHRQVGIKLASINLRIVRNPTDQVLKRLDENAR